jgi:SAM-dependent MidA family methyltransferase
MPGGAPVGDALVARIASRIAAAGGWMPFDDFMAEALYAPGLGYYSGGRRIFGLGPGSGSDFVTAPELSPFFGRALAVQVREALTASGSERVYEFGAGTGALAEQLLEALDADDADDDGMLRVSVDLTIIELSGHLRERQQARLARFGSRVRWLDAWPETMEGVVVGNEVLDAMPVKLLQPTMAATPTGRPMRLATHGAASPSPTSRPRSRSKARPRPRPR